MQEGQKQASKAAAGSKRQSRSTCSRACLELGCQGVLAARRRRQPRPQLGQASLLLSQLVLEGPGPLLGSLSNRDLRAELVL